MTARWLDDYFNAWARHAQAAGAGGSQEMDRLLSFMSEDIRYEDVPSGAVFVGHDGVRKMAAQALQMSADLTITLVSSVIADDQFAFETEARGTNTGPLGAIPATQRKFVLRGVSVGRIVGAKVVSHKDYWDLASFLRQVGLMP